MHSWATLSPNGASSEEPAAWGEVQSTQSRKSRNESAESAFSQVSSLDQSKHTKKGGGGSARSSREGGEADGAAARRLSGIHSILKNHQERTRKGSILGTGKKKGKQQQQGFSEFIIHHLTELALFISEEHEQRLIQERKRFPARDIDSHASMEGKTAREVRNHIKKARGKSSDDDLRERSGSTISSARPSLDFHGVLSCQSGRMSTNSKRDHPSTFSTASISQQDSLLSNSLLSNSVSSLNSASPRVSAAEAFQPVLVFPTPPDQIAPALPMSDVHSPPPMLHDSSGTPAHGAQPAALHSSPAEADAAVSVPGVSGDDVHSHSCNSGHHYGDHHHLGDPGLATVVDGEELKNENEEVEKALRASTNSTEPADAKRGSALSKVSKQDSQESEVVTALSKVSKQDSQESEVVQHYIDKPMKANTSELDNSREKRVTITTFPVPGEVKGEKPRVPGERRVTLGLSNPSDSEEEDEEKDGGGFTGYLASARAARVAEPDPDEEEEGSEDDDEPHEFAMWPIWHKVFGKGADKVHRGTHNRQMSITNIAEADDSSDEDDVEAAILATSMSFCDDTDTKAQLKKSMTRRNSKQSRRTSVRSSVDAEGPKPSKLKLFFFRLWGKLIMSPSGHVHTLWDPFSAILVAWECFIIPLQFFDLDETPGLLFMAWLVRIFWTVDLCISSITAYHRPNGRLERHPWHVWMHYVKSWFPFDICLVCIDWMEVCLQGVSNYRSVRTTRMIVKSLRCIRVMRVVRFLFMLRQKKLPAILKDWEYLFRSELVLVFFGLVRVIAFVLYCNHVLACMWFALSDMNESATTNWFVKRELTKDTSFWLVYMSSYQWSLAQFAGSVEVQSASLPESTYAIVCCLCAYVISACVVSSITSSMTRLQMATAQNTEMFTALKQYLYDNQISRKVALRVQRQAQAKLQERKKNRPEESVELLALISEPLMIEIHFEMRSPLISFHPFFRDYYHLQQSMVKQICHTCVDRLQFVKGDVIFSPGELPSVPQMYFSQNGHLSYTQFYEDETRESTSVEAGEWFSEPVLWTPWVHVGLMRARGECVILCIDTKAFQSKITKANKQGYPCYVYGKAFVDAMNLLDPEHLTDLYHPEMDIEAIVEQACPLTEGSARQRQLAFLSKNPALMALRRTMTSNTLGA